MVGTAECELDHPDPQLLDDESLIAELRAGECQRRRLEARQACITRELDRRKVWKTDGHASIKGLLRVTTNRAPWEITALVQTGELLADRPEVATAMHAGTLGVAQAHSLAKALAHPRCGSQYGDVADVLLSSATGLPFRDFATVLERWISIADQNGADERAEANHTNRDAFFHVGRNGFHGEIRGGTLQGEAATEILDRFVQAEFDKDWAWVLKEYGDAATASLMPRPNAQRRFDAWMAVLHQAVAAPPGSQPPEPVVNVLVDPPASPPTWASPDVSGRGVTPRRPDAKPTT